MKNFLYGLVGIGLVLNIWTNLDTFNQTKISIEKGDLVTHSFKILQAIDAVKLSIHEFQKNSQFRDSVHEKLKKLSEIVVTPNLKQKTSNLANLFLEEPTHEKVQLGLLDLAAIETSVKSIVSVREESAHLSDVRALNRVVFSGFVDFCLLLIILTSFLYERKIAAKLQKALSSALAHVETVNQSLQRNLINKESALKTTIHDLKNPLGSIRGFAEILSEEAGGNKSISEMTQIIQRISNNALSLVESLLQTDQKIETEANEDVRILDVLKETCDFLEPIIQKKRQKINFKRDVSDFIFFGSRQQIQDVFYNIISNASKFSPLNSIITLDCVDLEEFHEVHVKDEGPGFTQDDFSKMFLLGAKLSAKPSSGESSTSIGLYSVKRTIESFKGSIEVVNNAARGACVKIRFPVR